MQARKFKLLVLISLAPLLQNCAQTSFDSASQPQIQAAAPSRAPDSINSGSGTQSPQTNQNSYTNTAPVQTGTTTGPSDPGPSSPTCPQDLAHKPSVQQLIDKGIDDATATDILYGVIGSAIDSRNWAAIIGSSDVVATARAATAAMYNGYYCRGTGALKAPWQSPDYMVSVVAQVGNFQYLKSVRTSDGTVVYFVMVVDGEGYALRSISSASDAVNFGFDMSALHGLKLAVEAAGQPMSYFLNLQ